MAEPGLKLCFVIAPIGEPNSDVRKRSDQVFTHVIEPAAEACGYRAQRPHEIPDPGIITRQIIDRLINDPMVVADLTGHNANVFYELAIRHATRKPLVQMIEEGEQIPFDVSAVRTIKINHRDLDSAAAARRELERHIRSAENDPLQVDNPITSAIDLKRLQESGEPQQALMRCPRTLSRPGKASNSKRDLGPRRLLGPVSDGVERVLHLHLTLATAMQGLVASRSC